MKVITSNNQHEREIFNLVKQKPKFFYIATFNVRTDSFLNKVISGLPSKCDIRLIVGISEDMNKSKIKRIRGFLSTLKIKYKITKDFHTKLVVSNHAALVGGRNLTNSSWKDLTVTITDRLTKDKLKRHFENLFDSVKNVK